MAPTGGLVQGSYPSTYVVEGLIEAQTLSLCPSPFLFELQLTGWLESEMSYGAAVWPRTWRR